MTIFSQLALRSGFAENCNFRRRFWWNMENRRGPSAFTFAYRRNPTALETSKHSFLNGTRIRATSFEVSCDLSDTTEHKGFGPDEGQEIIYPSPTRMSDMYQTWISASDDASSTRIVWPMARQHVLCVHRHLVHTASVPSQQLQPFALSASTDRGGAIRQQCVPCRTGKIRNRTGVQVPYLLHPYHVMTAAMC
jgi:hypothetical protein